MAPPRKTVGFVAVPGEDEDGAGQSAFSSPFQTTGAQESGEPVKKAGGVLRDKHGWYREGGDKGFGCGWQGFD